MRVSRFKKNLSMFVVPTGVGASIGGFAGDASPYAQKLAQHHHLIVNPNVVNAACFSGLTPNMLYVEGWTLGQFMKGDVSLIPSSNNRIGIIFDKAISSKILNIHINTINAVKTVYGCNVMGYEVTDENCGVEFFMTNSGVSSGRVANNETLLRAAKKLIFRGAETIAVVCHFDEPPEDGYKYGTSPDIVGGIEAIISHYLTKELMVPVVHSPAFESIDITSDLVDSRVSAEYITPTFLPCILLGLQNAPMIHPEFNESYINYTDLKSLIVPYNALGSSIVLDAISRHIPVLAIKENNTIMNVNKYNLGLESTVLTIETYQDCNEFLNEVFGTCSR